MPADSMLVPPHVLLIHRESVTPGAEDAYARIEEEITRICFDWRCPHPYLGVESLTGPTEVWFFNGYESRAQQQEVAGAYAANSSLIERMTEASRGKAALTHSSGSVVASLRPEFSRGPAWAPGCGRYLVVLVTRSASPPADGTVFDADDGTRFIIRAAAAREDGNRAAAALGTGARVFVVRPTWSTPAKAWIDADAEFWRAYPPPAR